MRTHWILWCMCTYYDFATPVSLKCWPICYQSTVFWRGSFEITNLGVRERKSVGMGINRKPSHNYFLIALSAKFCYICRRFVGIPMSNFAHPNSTPASGVRVDLGGQKWYQSKCHPHIPIRLLYTSIAYLVPFRYNTQRCRQEDDRQTEWSE